MFPPGKPVPGMHEFASRRLRLTQLEKDFKIHPCIPEKGWLYLPYLVLAVDTPHANQCSAVLSVLLEDLKNVECEPFSR